MECWVKSEKKWELLKTYDFAGYSGSLGPKLRAGDGQIPEGIYKVENLNPNSRFYLSIKINYPNETDIINSKKENRNNPGGDIFIHGKNVTIGCIPIGDRQIEEVFYLVAKIGKNRTTIILSPRDFRKKDVLIPKTVNWISELYNTIAIELMKYQN